MITLRAALAIVLLFGVYLLALLGIAVAGGFVVLIALSIQDYAQGEVQGLRIQLLAKRRGTRHIAKKRRYHLAALPWRDTR